MKACSDNPGTALGFCLSCIIYEYFAARLDLSFDTSQSTYYFYF